MHIALRKLPLGSTNYGRRPVHRYYFGGLGSLGQDSTDTSSLPFDLSAPAYDINALPTPSLDFGTGIAAPGEFQPADVSMPSELTLPPSLSSPAIINLPGGGQGALDLNAIESAAVGLTSAVTRPTPSTSPTGMTAGGGTSVAQALNWFSQANLLPGVPNGLLILGGALAIVAIGALGRRR